MITFSGWRARRELFDCTWRRCAPLTFFEECPTRVSFWRVTQRCRTQECHKEVWPTRVLRKNVLRVSQKCVWSLCVSTKCSLLAVTLSQVFICKCVVL